jgi:hypothetical protein
VDYIYTIDSDLTVCGTDVITNLSDNGSCWVATYDHLMNSKLPKMFKTANSTPKVITYTDELLRHIACYLGNDYIGRCHQNGVGTIGKNFIVKIANEDGTLKESNVVEETIKERCSKSVDQETHLKLWKQVYLQFKHAPAYLILPSNYEDTPRQAIINREYEIKLGPYDVGRVNTETWSNTVCASWGDENCSSSEALPIGWNPIHEFHDQLNMLHNESEDRGDLYKKCFNMELWSKQGQEIKKLEAPTLDNGDVAHHGSILDFDTIAINCFSIISLKFWLASRQISFINTEECSLASFVNQIWMTIDTWSET